MEEIARHCEQCRTPLPSRAERRTSLCRPCSRARSIRRAAERYAAQVAADGKVLRTCSKCGDTIAARSGTWPMSHGSPSGTLCLRCFHVRQKDVDARIKAKARSPVRQLRAVLVTARDLERQRCILGADADVAVRLGAEALNLGAESAAKQLAEAIEDPMNDFHRAALELLANRILPQKVYSTAGARLARSGALDASPTDKPQSAPRFVVNVGLTHGLKEKS